jgi:hypothetical protein
MIWRLFEQRHCEKTSTYVNVIPAQAGIHAELPVTRRMDSRLRGNDGFAVNG